MKIGIIGGSFDPFHLGHKRIINETISKLNLDKMLIMPTKHNPWKDDCVANDKQRIDMIHLTMEGNKQYEISRIELDNPTNEKNYTIDTIKTLNNFIQVMNFILLWEWIKQVNLTNGSVLKKFLKKYNSLLSVELAIK